MTQDLPSAEYLNFDTDAYPPAEAFERYRRFYGFGADVVQIGPAVSAQVRAWRLDRMLLYDRRLNDVGHRRDADKTQQTGFSHFTVTLLLAGEVETERGGKIERLAAGEVQFADTATSGSNRMHNARIVTLAIARDQLTFIAGDPERLHGLTLLAEQARMFSEFVVSLIRNIDAIGPDNVIAASGILKSLLTMAVDASGFGRAGGGLNRLPDRLSQLRRLVDHRLSDPAFDAAAVVRESGLSRATVYRLLPDAGGLTGFLRERRLERLRKLLSDAAENRPVSELVQAVGLPSISHASRAFLTRYGVRPAAYREVVAADSGEDAFHKLRLWQNEVQ
jgi:AraC-like DNA-binding protein